MAASKLKNDIARKLDQFYTDPDYAKKFLTVLAGVVDLDEVDHLVEPSAGSGSFYHHLDPIKRIGLDIDPAAPDILKANFLEWMHPFPARIITVGNPPFGKNSNLAVKFFNRAAEFSEVIAFILPRTFRKDSVINRLNKFFHLVYDENVPDNSFIFNGCKYDVPCAAQIWVRKSEKRPVITSYKLSQVAKYFEIVSPEQADFAIQRVGGRAGLIRVTDYKCFSRQSHYFIKAHNKNVLPIFQQINFNGVKFNTAGNPSISPSELVKLFIEQASVNGLNIALFPSKRKI